MTDFCYRCQRVTESNSVEHPTYTEWLCAECGWQVDCDFEDDYGAAPDLIAAARQLAATIARLTAERDELRRLILSQFETDLRYSEMETAFVSGDNVVVPGMAEAAKLRSNAENAVWLKGQELYEARELAERSGT